MEEQSGSKLINKTKSELFGIDIVFEEFTRYLTLMNDFLTQQALQFEKELPKYRKEIDEISMREANKDNPDIQRQYWGFLDSQLCERQIELTITFQNNFRGFFLTQVYSFVETELRKICEYHHTIKNNECSLDDIKSDGDLEKIKKYLKFILGATEYDCFVKNDLQMIDDMRRVRKTIVHHQGLINDKSPNWGLIRKLAKRNLITLDNLNYKKNEYLILFNGNIMIMEFIETSKNLFNTLLEDNIIDL
jgi:hypothetical protein